MHLVSQQIINSGYQYVFFDVDYTVLRINSGFKFASFLYKKNILSLKDILPIPYKILQYKFGNLDYRNLVEYALSTWKKHTVSSLKNIGEEFYHSIVKNEIYKDSLQIIQDCQKNKIKTVLITASPEEVIRPLAQDLNTQYICTKLTHNNNYFTGKINGELCYGSGKVKLIQQHYKDAVNYVALSDSHTDTPLLESASLSIAINPDLKLKKISKLKKWPIYHFKELHHINTTTTT